MIKSPDRSVFQSDQTLVFVFRRRARFQPGSMSMPHAGCMLPGVGDVADDLLHTDSVLHLREYKRAVAAHLLRVALHHFQIRTHSLREVGLVDDEQVALRDPGAALPRNLVATRDVDDLNREVREFPAEA